ncbi:MAG: hypothetical protein CME61_03985 [Halobacteriovoraceae bacterium]|nr:hypothetical protein [Halobacteriovoraceae bacterium]
MNVESLYVHYPFCRHLCNYCDFHKAVKNSEKEKAFEKVLLGQILNNKKLLSEEGHSLSRLKTLYIGGGTPSLWGAAGLKSFIDSLKDSGTLIDPEAEFTLELNPGSWNDGEISKFIDLGVNRFSVGVQSLNPEILKRLDRVHSISDVYKTLKVLNDLKVNFSIDFMLGLPGSLDRSISDELDEVFSFGPSHISSYILTVGKGYIHYSELPSEERVSKEYLNFVEYLKKYRIYQYEVSNFSKKGFESKHNLQYWRSESVAALGPSATGLLVKNNEALRYKWKVGDSSNEFTREKLDSKTLHFERLYLALRIARNLNLKEFFSEDVCEKLPDICNSWKSNGFCMSSDPKSLTLTPKGFLFVDSLLSDLFPFLKN